MTHYWHETSLPTIENKPIVRLPEITGPPWEWARLLEPLARGGWAQAKIVRPGINPDAPADNALIDTGIVIRVYDALLDVSELNGDTLVKVDFHQPSKRWYVTQYKCYFTSY